MHWRSPCQPTAETIARSAINPAPSALQDNDLCDAGPESSHGTLRGFANARANAGAR